jgi:hypothetical protein
VIAAGAAVSALALLVVLIVLPLRDRWEQREAEIAAKREQLARLRGLVASERAIREALAAQRRNRGPLSTRLLTGATPALAASELQLLIQRYANQSRVSLERVDVVGEPKPAEEGLPAIPVQLSGQGDIYGLIDLLYYLQHGEKLLIIDEIQVTSAQAFPETMEEGTALPTSERNLLQWSVRLHGPYIAG